MKLAFRIRDANARRRRTLAGVITRFANGSREADCVISNSQRALDDMVVQTAGIDLRQYRRNPVVLRDHDYAKPIGTMQDLVIIGDELRGTIRFDPEGTSAAADETYRQVRAGSLRGISIGWTPLENKPTRDGVTHVRSLLHEISVTAIPAVHDALITATRNLRSSPGAPAGVDPHDENLRRARARMKLQEFDHVGAEIYRQERARRLRSAFRAGLM